MKKVCPPIEDRDSVADGTAIAGWQGLRGISLDGGKKFNRI